MKSLLFLILIISFYSCNSSESEQTPGNNQANNNNVNNNGAAFTADQIIGTDSQPLKEKSAKALSLFSEFNCIGCHLGRPIGEKFQNLAKAGTNTFAWAYYGKERATSPLKPLIDLFSPEESAFFIRSRDCGDHPNLMPTDGRSVRDDFSTGEDGCDNFKEWVQLMFAEHSAFLGEVDINKPTTVDQLDAFYTNDVLPILNQKGCIGCHNGRADLLNAGGDWSEINTQSDWKNRSPLIDKDNPFNSTLLKSLKNCKQVHHVPVRNTQKMPLAGNLEEEDCQKIIAWVLALSEIDLN